MDIRCRCKTFHLQVRCDPGYAKDSMMSSRYSACSVRMQKILKPNLCSEKTVMSFCGWLINTQMFSEFLAASHVCHSNKCSCLASQIPEKNILNLDCGCFENSHLIIFRNIEICRNATDSNENFLCPTSEWAECQKKYKDIRPNHCTVDSMCWRILDPGTTNEVIFFGQWAERKDWGDDVDWVSPTWRKIFLLHSIFSQVQVET